jgi:hypothetical protein
MPIGKFIGIGVGHLYYFLDKIYPEHNNGATLISTPEFLRTLVARYINNEPAPGGPAGAAATMGRGYRLGSGGSSSSGGGIFNMFSRQTASGSSSTSAGPSAAGLRQRQAGGQRLGSE